MASLLRRSAEVRRGAIAINTSHHKQRVLKIARASAEESPVYQGRFGPFQIVEEDEMEVFRYRSGLSLAAAGVSLFIHALMHAYHSGYSPEILVLMRQ